MRSSNQDNSSSPFNASITEDTSLAERWSDLMDFFSKNPPPPRHRRPTRFTRGRFYYPRYRKYNHRFCSHNKSSMSRPTSLTNRRRRRRIICFGCKKEGYILRNCPNHEQHVRRFQYFCHLGDAAEYILNNSADEVDDPGHEVLTYFADAEAEVLHLDDNHDVEDEENLDTWLYELFEVIDSSTTPSGHTMGQNSFEFVPFSIPELQDILYTMKLFSNVSGGQHILLDNGAPRSMCSEEWLARANWVPAKEAGTYTEQPTIPFCRTPGICSIWSSARCIDQGCQRQISYASHFCICSPFYAHTVPVRCNRSTQAWFRCMPPRTQGKPPSNLKVEQGLPTDSHRARLAPVSTYIGLLYGISYLE